MADGVSFDTSELHALEADLAKAAPQTVVEVTKAVLAGSLLLQKSWQSNAAGTSGRHGVHYPSSITAEQKPGHGSIGAEVGPDSSMPQGGMGKGFEYGSVNQPPHMDGNKATDVFEPLFIAAITKAANEALQL